MQVIGRGARNWNCTEHSSGQDARLWSTVGKNFVDVTRRQICIIWDNSDRCKARPNWEAELRSFQKEEQIGCQGTAGQFCAFFKGRIGQLIRGSSWGSTQFLRGRQSTQHEALADIYAQFSRVGLDRVVGSCWSELLISERQCRAVSSAQFPRWVQSGATERLATKNVQFFRMRVEQPNRGPASQICTILRNSVVTGSKGLNHKLCAVSVDSARQAAEQLLHSFGEQCNPRQQYSSVCLEH